MNLTVWGFVWHFWKAFQRHFWFKACYSERHKVWCDVARDMAVLPFMWLVECDLFITRPYDDALLFLTDVTIFILSDTWHHWERLRVDFLNGRYINLKSCTAPNQLIHKPYFQFVNFLLSSRLWRSFCSGLPITSWILTQNRGCLSSWRSLKSYLKARWDECSEESVNNGWMRFSLCLSCFGSFLPQECSGVQCLNSRFVNPSL